MIKEPQVVPAPQGAVLLNGRELTASVVEAIAHGAPIALDESRLDAVTRNRKALEEAVRSGQAIYGLTTGLGALVREDIDPEQAAETQRDFLRSHAAGVGEPLSPEIVRAALAIRLNCLLRAHSGIRAEILRSVAQMINCQLNPWVPATGSLGASGDLAPSAHAFLAVIGDGEFIDTRGRRRPAAEMLAEYQFAPVHLSSREAIALINGTHFMAGIGALAQMRSQRLLDSADLVAALSLEALRGFAGPFDHRVHQMRPLPGQARSAEIVRAAIRGSERIGTRTRAIQDAYTLRCIPQVHGSARQGLEFFSLMVAADLNAAIDNPIVFDDPVEIVSAGNFHGQSLALAFDTLRIALADIASISERRTFRIVSPSTNGDLPAFLSPYAGQGNGYMIAQYTAAALLSELRVLAHPVSIDSVPTSDNQEDHVSMGMSAGLLTLETIRRAEMVVAIEALCAAQAMEWGEGRPGAGVRQAYEAIRVHVPRLERDRPPAHDIDEVCALVSQGTFAKIVEQLEIAG